MFTSVRRLIIRTAATAITTLSVALWANTVLAGPPTSSAIVEYRDLDLSTDAGIQTLYKRIKSAADRLCFHETSGHDLIDKEELYFACYKEAVANAVERMGQARLTAIHRADSRLTAN